jgi:hypothetical protein
MYIIYGITSGVAAALCNVIMGQLKHVPVEVPAFKYLSIPLWIMAAVMLLTGISRRMRTP